MDGASEQSAICGNQPFGLSTSYILLIEGTQAPKFLPVWGPSVALLQPIESPHMSESPLSGCVGQRQKFGQNHHLTFVGSIRFTGIAVPAI
jgi:hypothetical protein